MDVQQIKGIGRKLKTFLNEFDDCFGRSEPREHLYTYVRGQLSDLPRKSVEPMALAAGIAPRTLQGFLSYQFWDGPHLRDRTQWIVARDSPAPVPHAGQPVVLRPRASGPAREKTLLGVSI